MSCRYKIREVTLEEGESKLFRGVRPIPQGNAPSHKEAPPRPRLGGRTLPAIELLTDVSKAGSCGRSSGTLEFEFPHFSNRYHLKPNSAKHSASVSCCDCSLFYLFCRDLIITLVQCFCFFILQMIYFLKKMGKFKRE